MTRLFTIARVVWLEVSRRKDVYVVFVLLLAALALLMSLNVFGLGAVTGYVATFSDISKLKHAESEIQHLAFYDPLTALPHDVDVKALLRIALVYDVPLAMSEATADLLLGGWQAGRSGG